MIHTNKYEPTRIDWVLHNTREHSSDGWRKLSKSLIELSDDDKELIANAPLLLAEVKRLTKTLELIGKHMPYDSWMHTLIKEVIGFEKRQAKEMIE